VFAGWAVSGTVVPDDQEESNSPHQAALLRGDGVVTVSAFGVFSRLVGLQVVYVPHPIDCSFPALAIVPISFLVLFLFLLNTIAISLGIIGVLIWRRV